jgi:dephospho-CoA kinase
MSLIIGVVGEIGSGKGVFIEFLKDAALGKKVERIAGSQILAETLALWDIKSTRQALQDLAIVMNRHYGSDTLAHAVWKRMSESTADIIVFDGVRWKSDPEMVRSFPDSLIIYVTADIHTRYDRIKVRTEKVGESALPYEQFLQEEKADTELNIPAIGREADIRIENSGSLDEYRAKVEEVYRTYILPKIS